MKNLLKEAWWRGYKMGLCAISKKTYSINEDSKEISTKKIITDITKHLNAVYNDIALYGGNYSFGEMCLENPRQLLKHKGKGCKFPDYSVEDVPVEEIDKLVTYAVKKFAKETPEAFHDLHPNDIPHAISNIIDRYLFSLTN